MFKRLVFLLMLITATVSVSPPAQAAGLTVTLVCDTSPASEDWILFIDCVARASGGISPYTFQWYRGTTFLKTDTTSGTSYFTDGCLRRSGTTQTFTVMVTDTRGAQGSASSTVTC